MDWIVINTLEVLNVIPQLDHFRRTENPLIKFIGDVLPRREWIPWYVDWSTTLLLPPLEKMKTNEVELTLVWCSWKRKAHAHPQSFGCGNEGLQQLQHYASHLKHRITHNSMQSKKTCTFQQIIIDIMQISDVLLCPSWLGLFPLTIISWTILEKPNK